MVTRKDCPLSIIDLNDDCIELILKKLNHYEQFRLTKVHTRFKHIIARMWRLGAMSVLVKSEHFTAFHRQTPESSASSTPTKMGKKKPQKCCRCDKKPGKKPTTKFKIEKSFDAFSEFEEFILSVVPFMKQLIMHNMPVEQLRKLSEIQIPSVAVFEWKADGTKEYEHLLDEDIVMMRKIFPNLEKLKLKNCQVTGKHLNELTALKNLSLDECHFLESEYFRDVFQSLKLRKFDIMDDCDELNCCDLAELQKCPTLEHIKIADYHLCLEPYILNSILRMPNLAKLSIYSRNFVFDVLERVSRNQIKSIQAFKYNGVLVHTERFFNEVGNMKSLKKLYFFECCTYEGIHDHCCAAVSQQLTELKEIHFIACTMQSEEALLHFIANCKDLELMSVSGSKNINNSFIWRSLDLLKRQKWRIKPLNLWISNTNVDKCIAEDPRLLCANNLLRIVFDKTLTNANPPGVLKFIFTL